MKATALRWSLGLALLGLAGAGVTSRGRFDAAALQTWVDSARAAGPIVYIAICTAATVLFLPGASSPSREGPCSGSCGARSGICAVPRRVPTWRS